MLRPRLTRTLAALQDGYRLVNPRTGYYLAVVLEGDAASHVTELRRRFNTDRRAKERRRYAGAPTFRLLGTWPPILLVRARFRPDPWLDLELLRLRLRGLASRVVDLRHAVIDIGTYSITTARETFRIRPARAEVLAAVQRIRDACRGRPLRRAVALVEKELRQFGHRFCATNAREAFARVQAHAEEQVMKLIAKEERRPLLNVRHRARSPLARDTFSFLPTEEDAKKLNKESSWRLLRRSVLWLAPGRNLFSLNLVALKRPYWRAPVSKRYREYLAARRAGATEDYRTWLAARRRASTVQGRALALEGAPSTVQDPALVSARQRARCEREGSEVSRGSAGEPSQAA